MRLFLVRHTEAENTAQRFLAGNNDCELTERGREQAEKLGWHLHKANFDLIYSGDRKRALATLKEIAYYQFVFPKVTQEVNERRFGLLEGMAVEEAQKRYPNFFWKSETGLTHIVLKPTGGEGWEEVRKRAKLFFDRLWRKSPNKKILVVSHGDFNRALIAYLLGWDNEKMYLLEQDNGCINEFEISEEKAGENKGDKEEVGNKSEAKGMETPAENEGRGWKAKAVRLNDTAYLKR